MDQEEEEEEREKEIRREEKREIEEELAKTLEKARPVPPVNAPTRREKDEEGSSNQETGQREPRRVKRDQALFVAQFAHDCNEVWDD